MSPVAPLTIANDLLSKIDLFRQDDLTQDAIALKRLELEADSLAKVDVVSGSIAKAGIAALQWDIESVQYWVNNALKQSNEVSAYWNAAATYQSVNRLDLVLDVILQLHARFPADQKIVKFVITSLFALGKFDQVDLVKKENLHQDAELYAGLFLADQIVKFAQQNKLEIETIQRECASAIKVLSDNKKRLRTTEAEIFNDPEGSDSLVIRFGFIGDIHDEIRLESELAQILADHEKWQPRLLSTELFYMKEEDVRNAL
jgi:hypothetical protein